MPAQPPATWHSSRVLLTLLLIFLCGSMTGALVMLYGVYPIVHKAPPAWSEDPQVSLERLKTELDLDPDQAREMARILDDFFMYYHSLQSQMDEVRANGKAQILQILDEPQKRKFEEMLEEIQDETLD